MSVLGRLLTTRWLARSPIGLFRAGFGFLFGGRLLLLEHRGRTSGTSRFAVLETVERPQKDVVIIASGFGRSAQWHRNLEAEPRCAVSIGTRRRIPATAELLSAEESNELLERYAARHPKLWERLEQVIKDATGEEHPEIPLVRLRLQR